MSVFIICERALGLMRGNRLILNPDQRTQLETLDYEGLIASYAQEEAVSCARHFAPVRDRLLGSEPWVFARKRARNLAAVAPSAGWQYACAVPDDCLHILGVVRESPGGKMICDKYEWIGNSLCSHYPVSEIVYTSRVTDTEKWDAAFAETFIYALASQIATGVTGMIQAAQTFEEGVQARISEAFNAGAIKIPLVVPPEAYNDVLTRAVSIVRGAKASMRLQGGVAGARMFDGLTDVAILEDETVECERHFAATRDRLLRSYPWVFARKSVMPAQLSTSRTGWRYTYQLPTDCINILTITAKPPCRETIEKWEQWGDTVSCNYPIAELRYTRRVEDVKEWDHIFEEAFIFALAADVLMGITGSPQAHASIERNVAQKIEDAKIAGAIKKPLSIRTETYGWHKFSDRFDPRYGEAEW